MSNTEQRKLLRSLETSFERGSVIFTEGDHTRELYILLAGEIEIIKNNTVIAVVSEPNTYLGEMSTLLGTPRTATLKAKTGCRMLRVPDDRVSDFIAHSPALGFKLAKLLAHRLQEMNEKYEAMMDETVPDQDASGAAFRRLTSNREHAAVMAFYKKNVGQKVPATQVVKSLDIPFRDLEPILMLYELAGLLQVDEKTITFFLCPSKSLRHRILNWVPGMG